MSCHIVKRATFKITWQKDPMCGRAADPNKANGVARICATCGAVFPNTPSGRHAHYQHLLGLSHRPTDGKPEPKRPYDPDTWT